LPEQIDELLDRLQRIREELRGDFEAKVEQLDHITATFMANKKKEG